MDSDVERLIEALKAELNPIFFKFQKRFPPDIANPLRLIVRDLFEQLDDIAKTTAPLLSEPTEKPALEKPLQRKKPGPKASYGRDQGRAPMHHGVSKAIAAVRVSMIKLVDLLERHGRPEDREKAREEIVRFCDTLICPQI